MKLQQICVKLWCEVPGGSGNCKTAEMPAADGTPCGNGKVLFVVFSETPLLIAMKCDKYSLVNTFMILMEEGQAQYIRCVSKKRFVDSSFGKCLKLGIKFLC